MFGQGIEPEARKQVGMPKRRHEEGGSRATRPERMTRDEKKNENRMNVA
jgi:hypothetical protein